MYVELRLRVHLEAIFMFVLSFCFCKLESMEEANVMELRTRMDLNYNSYWHWPVNDTNLYYAWKERGCRINDVSNWPVDASRIFDDGRHVLMLGSVKSACRIPVVNRKLGVNIDIVVTMNADDKPCKGELIDYETYYRNLRVKNLRYGGFDPPNLRSADYDTKKREYLARWEAMCDDIDYASQPTGKVTILFHCFTGVHRSAGALCAFLVMRKHHSARGAVMTLVHAGPGQLYWKHRDYFIEALIELARRGRSSGSVNRELQFYQPTEFCWSPWKPKGCGL